MFAALFPKVYFPVDYLPVVGGDGLAPVLGPWQIDHPDSRVYKRSILKKVYGEEEELLIIMELV